MTQLKCKHANQAAIDMPDEIACSDLSDFYKIFGDYTRIRLLFLIKDHECCVHDLSVLLNMQQPAVSHQLKVLRQYKVVKTRRNGKEIFYSLNDDHILKILELGLQHINE